MLLCCFSKNQTELFFSRFKIQIRNLTRSGRILMKRSRSFFPENQILFNGSDTDMFCLKFSTYWKCQDYLWFQRHPCARTVKDHVYQCVQNIPMIPNTIRVSGAGSQGQMNNIWLMNTNASKELLNNNTSKVCVRTPISYLLFTYVSRTRIIAKDH